MAVANDKAIELHGTGSSAWVYRGHVIRHVAVNAWQVRRDNGSGWGNGDLLNTVASKRRAMQFIDAQEAA